MIHTHTMAYDEVLADRVRDLIAESPAITERKMFGGLCLLEHGNMIAGIMVRSLLTAEPPTPVLENR